MSLSCITGQPDRSPLSWLIFWALSWLALLPPLPMSPLFSVAAHGLHSNFLASQWWDFVECHHHHLPLAPFHQSPSVETPMPLLLFSSDKCYWPVWYLFICIYVNYPICILLPLLSMTPPFLAAAHGLHCNFWPINDRILLYTTTITFPSHSSTNHHQWQPQC